MASAYDKCIKNIMQVASAQLGHAAATNIVKAVHSLHATNLANAANKAIARQLTMQQLTGLIDREALALAQQKRQNAFQRLRFATARAKALGYDNLVDGWRASYVGVERYEAGSRDSADSRMTAYTADFHSYLETRLKEEGILDDFTADVGDDYALGDMIEALGKPGTTPSTQADPLIIKSAKVVRDVYGKVREEARRAGAYIAEISDYMGRQMHDADKMASPDKKLLWLWDMRNRLDFDAILHPEKVDPNDPEISTEAEKEEFLESAYSSIVSGVRFDNPDKPMPLVSGRGPNIANRMGQERLFKFKTPRDFVDHNVAWGRGSLKNLLYESLNTTGRQLGVLATLGPKPDQFHEDMHKALREEARVRYEGDPEHQRKEVAKVDAFYNTEGKNQLQELTARTRGIDSKLMAYLGGEARALTGTAMLGFAPISSLNDLLWIGFDNKYMGDSPFKAFVSPMIDFTRLAGKAALKGGPFNKRDSQEIKFVSAETGAIAHITNDYMSARVGGDTSNSKGLFGTLAHWLHRISGMTFFDKANRVAMAAQLMARLGSHADMDHVTLSRENPDLARGLGLYGIGEPEWNLMRQFAQKSPEVGYKFISGRSLDNITDDQIKAMMTAKGVDVSKAGPLTLGRYKSDLRQKFFQMVIDRGDHGNFVQRTKEAALINAGTRKGSFNGEINRALGVFKSFPLAAYQRGVKRELWGRNVSKTRAMVGLGSMVVTMSAFGVVQQAMKRYLHGQDPEPLSVSSLLEGAAEGGGLGIWTDFLTKEYSESYGKRSFLDTIMGPEIGTIGKAIDTISELKSATYDPTQRAQAVSDLTKIVKSMIPFQNLWYTNQAFNYFLWYQLEEYLHPGILARQEAARRRIGLPGPHIPPSAIASPPTANPATVVQRIIDARRANP